MAYIVNFGRNALKELAKIHEPHYPAIKTAIYNLVDNPRPHGCKKLQGGLGYRIKAGKYRIIYDIFDTELLIEIITLGHRKDLYR